MFCSNCGTQRPNDSSPCPNCGLPAMPLEAPPLLCTNCGAQRPNATSPCPNCGQTTAAVSPLPPLRPQVPNYLAQSILVTICCCVPLGIPAIVYSSQVNGKAQAGDIQGAIAASNNAKMWAWIAFAAGALTGVLYMLAAVAGGFE